MSDYSTFFRPASRPESAEELVAGATGCIDAFTERFNDRDLAGMDALLHFPHVMYSAEELLVWERPGQLPSDFFDKLASTGWAKSVYESRTPVLVSPNKAHFLVHYTRRRADESVISRHENLWIVIKARGTWRIALRSY
ncbi:MAG TPA: hypothetical protein VMH26_09660 [Burkholderiales bacterium]|nr:hypothetical protein [Burkholderiales bacterium]